MGGINFVPAASGITHMVTDANLLSTLSVIRELDCVGPTPCIINAMASFINLAFGT